MEMLSAASYERISHRGRVDVQPAVARALEKVVGALPTTVAPKDRSALIQSILGDLGNEAEAPGRRWPEDLKTLALTAVKTLGRNPIGSESLAERKQLEVVLHHAGVLDRADKLNPLPRRNGSASSSSSSGSALAGAGPKTAGARSPGSSPVSTHPRRHSNQPSPHEREPPGLSATQTEAISILANTLTLHPALSRKHALDLGTLEGALRMLKAGCRTVVPVSAKGKERDLRADHTAHEQRVFLLSRVLFLLTVQPGKAVLAFVDDEGGVDVLVQAIESLRYTPSSYMASSELLKLLYTVVAQYNPSIIAMRGGDTIKQAEAWNEAFDPLLPILIHLVHALKINDLLPPLTNVVNALTLFPVSDELAPIWLSPPALSPESPTEGTDRLSSSPKKLSIYNRITRTFSAHDRKATEAGELGASLSPASAASSSPRSSHDSTRTDLQQSSTVQRLLTALDNFLSNNLPPLPLGPDDPLPPSAKGVVMDEILPPVFALFTSMVANSEILRSHFKAELLPDSLDRAAGSTPLEKRPSLLGHLLRFLRAAAHPQCQQTLDFFIWSLCDSNADIVLREIGYGNAAGLLFRRGIAMPQAPKEEAHIEKLEDEVSDITKPALQETPRDPITSLKSGATSQPNPLADMTDEEKEREAERLFTLFDRMDRNPAMKMVNPMEEAVRKGDVKRWEEADDQEELRKLRLEEEADEAEAIKEIAAWKARTGKA